MTREKATAQNKFSIVSKPRRESPHYLTTARRKVGKFRLPSRAPVGCRIGGRFVGQVPRESVNAWEIHQRVSGQAASKPVLQLSHKGYDLHRIDTVRDDRLVQPQVGRVNSHLGAKLVDDPFSNF